MDKTLYEVTFTGGDITIVVDVIAGSCDAAIILAKGRCKEAYHHQIAARGKDVDITQRRNTQDALCAALFPDRVSVKRWTMRRYGFTTGTTPEERTTWENVYTWTANG